MFCNMLQMCDLLGESVEVSRTTSDFGSTTEKDSFLLDGWKGARGRIRAVYLIEDGLEVVVEMRDGELVSGAIECFKVVLDIVNTDISLPKTEDS